MLGVNPSAMLGRAGRWLGRSQHLLTPLWWALVLAGGDRRGVVRTGAGDEEARRRPVARAGDGGGRGGSVRALGHRRQRGRARGRWRVTTRASLARLERRAERVLGRRELCSCQPHMVVTRHVQPGDPPAPPFDTACANCGRQRDCVINIVHKTPFRQV